MPRVTVHVVDHNTGKPVDGAAVSIGGAAAYTVNGVAVLDAPAGMQTLTVTHSDYEAYSRPVYVYEGASFYVRLIPVAEIWR